MRIRPLRLLAWVVVLAIGLALWSALVPTPSRGRLDAWSPFVQLLALRPTLAVLALLAGAAWAVVAWRRRRGSAPALALVVIAGAAVVQIAPRAISSGPPSDAGPTAVTVLTANLLRSAVRPAVIAGLVRRTGAGVVVLPETNRELAGRIADELTRRTGEGWQAEADRTTPSADDGTARPTALVVRRSLGPRRLPDPRRSPGAHGQVRVRLTALPGGGDLQLAAVHPRPPAPAASQRDWRGDLLALRPLCRAGWVVAGDFNATIDHSPVRALLGSGCRDAASHAGTGLRATWSGGPLGLVRPAIDHVLSSGGWTTTDAGVLPIAGSDHRAVWARVVRRTSG